MITKTIDDEFKADFYDIYGESKPAVKDEDYDKTKGYFKKEYDATRTEGETPLDYAVTFTEDQSPLEEQWDSYLRGGDPFGLHKLGASSVVEGLADLSNDRLSVIWELFEKLVSLTRSIQNSAISLAEGAEYSNKTQAALISKTSEIDPSNYGGGSDDTAGQSAYTTRAQSQIDNLNALRTIESGEGDQWTSAMQSATQSAQSQSQLLSLIVSQMSGIVSAIFR